MGHLERDDKHYGNIGEPTIFKDVNGQPLYIGDTIMLYDGNAASPTDECVVVKTEEDGEFIDGIEMDCMPETGEITSGWRIVKHRSYTEVTEDEINEVRYIRSEEN